MPWKSSSGRSKGQPVVSDCSGKAGMVAGGGRNDWIGAGSELGKAGRGRIPGRRMRKWKIKRINRVLKCGNIIAMSLKRLKGRSFCVLVK